MDFKELAENSRILEIRVGSHLFGTNLPDADEDFAGIFMPSKELLYGFQQCNEVKFDIVAKDKFGRNTAEAVDRTIYEFRKFCRLALQNNPNILHILFADDRSVVFFDSFGFGQRLREKKDLFLHKGCYHRFVSYAKTQKHKMIIRNEHLSELEEGLEILETTPDHMVMADLRSRKPFLVHGDPLGKHIKLGDLCFEAGVFAKKARRMIQERLSKATNRAGLMRKYGFDTKFASNLIHLLREGIDILRFHKLTFPLPYAQDIIDIKQGKYSAEDIIAWSDELEAMAASEFTISTLRTEPLATEIEAWVITTMDNWLH